MPWIPEGGSDAAGSGRQSPGWYSPTMKSAYELALEQLEKQGIERPREGNLDEATRERMAEIRSKAQAELAELEILHRDAVRALGDPTVLTEAEEEYRRERQRIEERRDARLQKLRAEAVD